MQRILAPLDGSAMAEAALPAITYFASRSGATVVLLHVLEQRAPATRHGDRHLTAAAEADRYLAALAERLRADGLTVETHVHDSPQGNLARSLADHADELQADLIALCSHGDDRLRNLLWGSVAQQVLSHGRQPVLLVPPRMPDTAKWQLQSILVPLDGTPAHEPALAPAQDLARLTGARLELLLVIATSRTLRPNRAATGVWLPITTKAILELAAQGGQEYLTGLVAACQAAGLPAEGRVLRGDAADELLAAERQNADLMVMATHGRRGLDAWLEHSVAPRVTEKAQCPLLLVRAEE
jgi:nucleotide-binding universal stress UspA family protein